jgi:hypothetical protein
MSRFVPILAIWSLTMAVAPWPMATIAITAATPMMMPSVVRNDRTLFRAMARSDALTMKVMRRYPASQAANHRSNEWLPFHAVIICDGRNRGKSKTRRAGGRRGAVA